MITYKLIALQCVFILLARDKEAFARTSVLLLLYSLRLCTRINSETLGAYGTYNESTEFGTVPSRQDRSSRVVLAMHASRNTRGTVL